MAENTWSATTTADWIHINNAESGMTIGIDKAKSPNDDANGSIVIETDNEKIVKTIKRCLPVVTSTTKSLSFEVLYNDETLKEGGIIGGCDGGSSAYSGISALQVANIILTVTQHLDNGDSIPSSAQVSTNDVNIWYIFDDESKLAYLPSNDGPDRNVTIEVELKNDNNVSNQIQIHQRGYKKSDGTIDEEKLIEYGYESSNIVYRDFDFSGECKNMSVGCESGNTVFSVKGNKVIIYAAKTGLTECNKKVIINNGSESEPSGITVSGVKFSVIPQTDVDYFNDNTLYYGSNETRITDKVLTIKAELIDNPQYTAETTFTVKAGDCGKTLYIVFKSDKNTIDYTGGTVEFTYYLSETENGEETTAINDENIYKCLSFIPPEGVQIGNSANNNGIFTVNTIFNQNTYKNGEEGITWRFTADCEIASTKTLNIYQASKYENIIPNCDYFVFNYKWSDADGKDLDSLTHITNLPQLKAMDDNNVSGKTVGYGSTGGYTVNGDSSSNYLLYLKHGGDNTCSGAEGAIVCLKNILNSGQVGADDTIYVDIYANWYRTRNAGNMTIEYKQFSGLTSGGSYSDEINEVVHGTDECPGIINPYYTFEPKDGACQQIGTTQTTPTINVNAAGSINYNMAKNISCIDGAYTHVLRLKYNVSSQVTSLEYFTDNGINTQNFESKISISSIINNLPYRTVSAETSGGTIEYKNVYFKHKANGILHDVYLFDDDKDYINCVEYEKTNGYSYSAITRYTYSSTDFNNHVKKDFDFIKQFEITKNTDNTINIVFKVDKNSKGIDKEFDLSFTSNVGYILPCGKMLYNLGLIETYQKHN